MCAAYQSWTRASMFGSSRTVKWSSPGYRIDGELVFDRNRREQRVEAYVVAERHGGIGVAVMPRR